MDNDPVRDGRARIEAVMRERTGKTWAVTTLQWYRGFGADAVSEEARVRGPYANTETEAVHDLARILGVTL